MKNNMMKKTKIFASLMKEKMWLQEMALEGWRLKEIKLGIHYTFEAVEAKKIIYEIDRFNLSKNPTIKDIKHKEEFLSVAGEMGWHIITHDEDLNYYLYKEYIEGEINELYNDVESRQIHANKYRKRYQTAATEMMKIGLFMSVFMLMVATIKLFVNSLTSGYLFFGFCYTTFIFGCNYLFLKLGEFYYRELLMTQEEWKEVSDYKCDNIKIVRKLICSGERLGNFLNKQSKEGWHLTKISMTKYSFRKGDPLDYTYTLDSKYYTNKRLRELGINEFKDRKDWSALNNDWQVESVKHAEDKGWNYVCALENKVILYRGKAVDILKPINKKNKLYFRFLMGNNGVHILIGGIVGFIIGIIVSIYKYI